MPRTLKLTIAYDGSAYAGWQRQANAQTIQAVIEDEIAAIVGTHVPLVAAGRTDAGVHAAAQVASLRLEHPIATDDLHRALNARLTRDIRIRAVEEMFDGFDARQHATGKTYRYAIWSGAAPSPFIRHVVWHVGHALDVGRMSAAASALIGEHDFVAFQGRGADVVTTMRRIDFVEVVEVDIHTDTPVALSGSDSTRAQDAGRLIRLEISGNGFLRHMVRTIAGTLVDIGRGKMAPEEMKTIIESGVRASTGQTAPAHGLMLWEVRY